LCILSPSQFEDYVSRIHTNSEDLYKELKNYFRIFITDNENITDEIYAAETDTVEIRRVILFLKKEKEVQRQEA
jgi:hypothetical protein